MREMGIWCNTIDEMKDAIFYFKAVDIASQVGFPCMIRPSNVLGGRGMSVVHNIEELKAALCS